jgi:hypothetical protein
MKVQALLLWIWGLVKTSVLVAVGQIAVCNSRFEWGVGTGNNSFTRQ